MLTMQAFKTCLTGFLLYWKNIRAMTLISFHDFFGISVILLMMAENFQGQYVSDTFIIYHNLSV